MGGRGGSSHRITAAGGFANAKAFLTSAYGEDHANAILAYLASAPDYIQGMWADYGSSFRAAYVIDPDDDRAYYSPASNDVYLGIRNVAKGDSIHTPYSTVFHEYGHMTDFLIAKEQGFGKYTSYSEVYKGGLLGRTAKQEVEGHISRIRQQNPNLSRTEAARLLASEASIRYTKLDRGDISDIMEGAGIGFSFPLGAGHGSDYWIGRDNGKEIFAEITSAEAAHPGSLTAIKDYFPKTYQVYRDMIKERKRK